MFTALASGLAGGGGGTNDSGSAYSGAPISVGGINGSPLGDRGGVHPLIVAALLAAAIVATFALARRGR